MNSDSYLNSASLAHACPPIRLSHPPALDNTVRFGRGSDDVREVTEEPKVVLCFDCQRPIEAGKGVQVRRLLRVNPVSLVPSAHIPILHTTVHPECNSPDKETGDGHG